jgi:prepilin-type N-terminal cleavage/methylation domain-containing protein
MPLKSPPVAESPSARAGGFTLVELLIVVAIIALLAAIAIPNMLEAQTRARVSRVKAELRTAATAIEVYAVDHNRPPMNDGFFNILPAELTTPVAYIQSVELTDPFSPHDVHPIYGLLPRYYTYTEIVTVQGWIEEYSIGRPPPLEAIDDPLYNNHAFEKYGKWRLVSDGPDRSYTLPGHKPGDDPTDPNDMIQGIDVPYDPTNGTDSSGNIMRTQKSPEPKFPLL